MAEPKIAQRFPYILNLDAGTYLWCRCGKSASQPFCDGSHKDTEFTPLEFTVDKKSTVTLCGCKHTKDAPFCDSSHSRL